MSALTDLQAAVQANTDAVNLAVAKIQAGAGDSVQLAALTQSLNASTATLQAALAQ